VIFWDTSAVVPLLVHEPRSADMRELAERDQHLVVWWGTSVECYSALARREREGIISSESADQARLVLGELTLAWTEILASEEVRSHATRLLRRHALRAADALQLAAALTWSDGRPDGHAFAALDSRLTAAARGEGFVLAVQP